MVRSCPPDIASAKERFDAIEYALQAELELILYLALDVGAARAFGSRLHDDGRTNESVSLVATDRRFVA